jgi:hypothetical protein
MDHRVRLDGRRIQHKTRRTSASIHQPCEEAAVELSDFVTAIQAMTDAEMRRVAVELDARSASPADEVSWWRAHITIDRAIRDHRCSRSASLAASSASHAVVAVAEAADLMLPDPAVTAVARAAADVARAFVAGPGATDALEYLLEAWVTVVAPVQITTSLVPQSLTTLPSRLPVPFPSSGPDSAIAAFG